MTGSAYIPAEGRARVEIDRQLAACGWVVQDRGAMNLYAGQGVAVREFIMAPGHGRADYLLFVDGKAVGAVEAKPSGTPLAGVEPQSAKYAAGLPKDLPALVSPLPFLYESTGDETMFTDGFDPDPRSRPVVTFHRPETLARWLRHWVDDADGGSLRARLQRLGPVGRRTGCAASRSRRSTSVEASMVHNHPRALAQMATGSGKTFMAANLAYRLVQTAGAERVLFLVDRANLGRQTLREFQQFATPGDGRKFTDLYNVQWLTSNRIDPAARVVITTVQRLLLDAAGRGGAAPRTSTRSPASEIEPDRPVEVAYNPTDPDRDVRRRDRRRVSPVDLRGVAAGHRVLRRLPRRAHRHAGQADVRVLQPEPRRRVRPRRGGRRRRERRLRRLPDPHQDQRAGLHRRSRAWSPSSASARPARSGWRSSTRTSSTTPASSTATSSPSTRSAPSSAPSATTCSSRSTRAGSSPAAARCPRR